MNWPRPQKSLMRMLFQNQDALPSNEVVEYLGLKLGDVIEWETFMFNGKRSARIRKLQ